MISILAFSPQETLTKACVILKKEPDKAGVYVAVKTGVNVLVGEGISSVLVGVGEIVGVVVLVGVKVWLVIIVAVSVIVYVAVKVMVAVGEYMGVAVWVGVPVPKTVGV